MGGQEEKLDIMIRGEELPVNHSYNEISIDLLPGKNEISFDYSGVEVTPENGEERALAFCLVNPELVVE